MGELGNFSPRSAPSGGFRYNWGHIDPAYLYEAMNEVSSRGGVISFMYGGFGHYFKASWVIDGARGMASGETPERFIHDLRKRLLGCD